VRLFNIGPPWVGFQCVAVQDGLVLSTAQLHLRELGKGFLHEYFLATHLPYISVSHTRIRREGAMTSPRDDHLHASLSAPSFSPTAMARPDRSSSLEHGEHATFSIHEQEHRRKRCLSKLISSFNLSTSLEVSPAHRRLRSWQNWHTNNNKIMMQSLSYCVLGSTHLEAAHSPAPTPTAETSCETGLNQAP
jgi:hypothetical protein